MGFLNQSIAQIRDLFASMTPAARITAALLVGVIGVSLAYLFQDYAAGGKEFLFNGEMMPPREVDAMEMAIAKKGLNDAERQGNRILVPRGEKAAYLAAILEGGALPANFDTLIVDELDNLSVLGDGKTRDARMKAARERQLSMLIRMMDGIEDAQVMFDIREPKGLYERKQISATVSVRPAAGEALTHTRARMIRIAVSKAIAGLEPENIAILNQVDGTQVDSAGDLNGDAYDEKYFQVKTTFEQAMKKKFERVLTFIPGVQVEVTAELEESLGAETRVIKPEGDSQTVSEETDQSEDRTTQIDDRGRPGLTVNGPTGTPPDQAVAKNEQSNNTNTRTAQSWVPTSEEVKQAPGLVPQHVRAAIAIPSGFLVRVWREQNKDAAPDAKPSAEDLTRLQGQYEDDVKRIVVPLLPKEPADDVYPNVQVSVFQSLTPDPIEPPSMMSEVLMWASGNSGTLIMTGLALVSLVMLRSMMKSIPVGETNVILQSASAAAGGAAGGVGAAAQGGGEGGGSGGGDAPGGKVRPKLRLKKGPSLKDDLSEMVREDPDAAAAILRTWISAAG